MNERGTIMECASTISSPPASAPTSFRPFHSPLPRVFKDFLARRTLTGKLISDAYNDVLLRFGLRQDFDILAGLYGYQEKFGRDVRAMNDFDRGLGLPPMVAMVLDQKPSTHGPTWRLAKLAESYLTAAGMTVIPINHYFQAHDGAILRVSRWESHPSAEAHRIFAEQFAAVIRPRPELQPYRK
jgi:hypothetical protein